MDISLNDSFSQVGRYLAALSEKQQVTSANIANAHTPGYTAQQIRFSDLLRKDTPFETRLSGMMGGRLDALGADTGRPVDLQREMVEMQKNLLYFSIVTRRAATIFSSLRAASQTGR